MFRGHPGKIVKMIFRTGVRYFLIGLSIKFIFQPVKKDITGQISRTLDQKWLYNAENRSISIIVNKIHTNIVFDGHSFVNIKMIFETADPYSLIGILMKCIFQPIKNDIIGQISTNAGSEIALQRRKSKYFR